MHLGVVEAAGADAVVIDIDLLGSSDLDISADHAESVAHLLVHLVLGQLVRVELHVRLLFKQIGISLETLEIELVLLLLDLGLVDGDVHIVLLLLLVRQLLVFQLLLLRRNQLLPDLLLVSLLGRQVLVLRVRLDSSLLDLDVGLVGQVEGLEAVLLLELSLQVAEELRRADGHVGDLNGLHPHAPAGEELLHVSLDAIAQGSTVLEDFLDGHVGDLVANEGLSDACDLVGHFARVLVLEGGTERLVESVGTFTVAEWRPNDHAGDAHTLHLEGDLVGREGHLPQLSRVLHELIAGHRQAREANTLLDALAITDEEAERVRIANHPVIVDFLRQKIQAVADDDERKKHLDPADGIGEPRDDHGDEFEEELGAQEQRLASEADCRGTEHLSLGHEGTKIEAALSGVCLICHIIDS